MSLRQQAERVVSGAGAVAEGAGRALASPETVAAIANADESEKAAVDLVFRPAAIGAALRWLAALIAGR
jgi:hypothetical protein